MSTYVVGDIQACYDGLRELLDKVSFSVDRDRLYAVGDLIGRGAQPLQTLQFLHGLEDRFDCVLGNHDLHFLAVSQGIKSSKPKDRYETILDHPDRDKLISWLRHKPLALIPQEGYFMCHAGLYPLWSESRALVLAKEVEQAIVADDWHELLNYMYGNEEQAWNENLHALPRLKFIIDAFTRMRFVNKDGTLNFTAKTVAEDSPIGFMPWFKHPKLRNKSNILFGHWAALRGKTGDATVLSLDTGYGWGGEMTLLRLEDNQRTSIQSPFAEQF